MAKDRDAGYDLIRTLAILIAAVGHVWDEPRMDHGVVVAFSVFSPGLAMSLLGFLSAALLTKRHGDAFTTTFFTRRVVRIYVPLVLCLAAVFPYLRAIGMPVANLHSVMHFLGLSAVYDLAHMHQESPFLGDGLWFITIILVLYACLPVLCKLFRHKNGLVHLVAVVAMLMALDWVMYLQDAILDVAIAFSIGAYLGFNDKLPVLQSRKALVFGAVAGPIALALCALATTGCVPWIPYETRKLLYWVYPLAFVPLLLGLARHIPAKIMVAVSAFSLVSYEFYILHFYFTHKVLVKWVPNYLPAYTRIPVYLEILLCLAVSFLAAVILYKIGSRLGAAVLRYLG